MGGALLDHRHLEAQLGRADGADIAAGAGADDGDVELFAMVLFLFQQRPPATGMMEPVT